jgi:hypothetical protein
MCFSDTALKETLLKSYVLPTVQRDDQRSDTSQAVNDCITSQDISWSNCVDICADGTDAFTDHEKGSQDELRYVAPHINFTQYVIHRKASASRDLPP